MRFLHLADLHFGKSIYGTSLIESGDQAAWVDRFLALAEEVRPDAVVIAGDVYDRSAPAAEAVALLDRMLTALTGRGIPVLLTAGNHDSAQRLAFARGLLEKQGLYISPALAAPGRLEKVVLQDESGPVDFWLMPYVFPALAEEVLGSGELRGYDAAVRALLAAQEIDFSRRNVLVAHQNVTVNGAEVERGGSETMVGGVGQVEYTAFDGFDYVALGHIHAGYAVGRPEVRYAGSPLCYHFNETKQAAKGPVLVELGLKGEPVSTEVLHIPPLHPMAVLEGPLEEVRDRAAGAECAGAYLQIVLTDCRVTPEVSAHLHAVCENQNSRLLELRSEYHPLRGEAAALTSREVREKSVPELFADFCAERHGGTAPEAGALELLDYAGELLLRSEPDRAPDPGDVERLLQFALKQEVAK